MLLAELVATSNAVAQTSGRIEKVGRLASVLKRLEPEEIEIAVAFLSGSPRQGRVGVAGSVVAAARSVARATVSTLGLEDVDACFGRIAASSGSGTAAARTQLLRDLLGRATVEEQDFLVRLLFGELRQGALVGLLVEGLTDGMLAWQTEKLLELELARDAYTVHVRPALVVETASTTSRKARSTVPAAPAAPGGGVGGGPGGAPGGAPAAAAGGGSAFGIAERRWHVAHPTRVN